MRKTQAIVCGILTMVLSLVFTACSGGLLGFFDRFNREGEGEDEITSGISDIGWAAQPDCVENPTVIVFFFNASVDTLEVYDISIAPDGMVTVGALTGGGRLWTLAIYPVRSGEIFVSINRNGFVSRRQTIDIFFDYTSVGWQAVANCEDNTTAIVFNFSAPVYIGVMDILIHDGTGSAARGVLYGGGTLWVLTVYPVRSGEIWVSINSPWISSRPVSIHISRGNRGMIRGLMDG